MSEEELDRLRGRAKEDRKLLEKAEIALAEIDRGPGLTNEQAEVLAAIRIRLTGKERGKLEDFLSAAGDIGSKKDLGDVLTGDESTTSDWPEIEEKKKDWPGL